MKNQLTSDQINEFSENGFLHIKNYYNLITDIRPIKEGIWDLINLLCIKYEVEITQKKYTDEDFDKDYYSLILKDRKYGAELYDAIKQLPEFMRLVTKIENEEIFKELFKTTRVGLSAQGYGIRMDNPNEDQYRSLWHYEYRDQFRSQKGLVFWSPLVKIFEDIGPVLIGPKSHKKGLIRSHLNDPDNPDKKGVYAMRLENETELIEEFGITQPLSSPGDLILLDFFTLHSSGVNKSKKTRWSMQFRYFDMNHPSGIKIGWKGVSENIKLSDIHPELIVK